MHTTFGGSRPDLVTKARAARSPRLLALAAVVVATATLGACGDSDSASSGDAAVTTEAVATTTTEAAATSTSEATTSTSTSAEGTSTTAAAAKDDELINTWSGASVDRTALPIGTSHVSTSAPAVGGLYVCSAGNPAGGGAHATGPWIDEEVGTWDLEEKVSVQGSVEWPMATYDEKVDGESRVITSNGLPVGAVTGTFPIAADDPAYQYDRNPNSIAETAMTMTLPVTPTEASSPGCMGMGLIGVMKNGVSLFAPVDELNRDAVAYETQDSCDGHPQQASVYHYHNIPSCILDASTGASTVVGFMTDGYPIVVERDADGNLPTNADLDECHGRTSPVLMDGEIVTTYHYSATYEFPYFVGCLKGNAA